MREAELAAQFLLQRIQRAAPNTWLQSPRRPPLTTISKDPALRLIATRNLHKLRDLEARALVGWGNGDRIATLFHRKLSPREVVLLQAKGRRCISILEDAPNARSFLLHDLRHLEKFFEPAHHQAQVGFFKMIAAVQEGAKWVAFDSLFDSRWQAERDYVLADMNGAPVFLLGYLKMRLRTAAGRTSKSYEDALEGLLDVLGLFGSVRAAARAIETRGGNGEAALIFKEFLEAQT